MTLAVSYAWPSLPRSRSHSTLLQERCVTRQRTVASRGCGKTFIPPLGCEGDRDYAWSDQYFREWIRPCDVRYREWNLEDLPRNLPEKDASTEKIRITWETFVIFEILNVVKKTSFPRELWNPAAMFKTPGLIWCTFTVHWSRVMYWDWLQ